MAFETAEISNSGGTIDNKQLAQVVVVAVLKAMVPLLACWKFQNSFKKYISHFRSNEMHFCIYLGRGFNIQEYKGN